MYIVTYVLGVTCVTLHTWVFLSRSKIYLCSCHFAKLMCIVFPYSITFTLLYFYVRLCQLREGDQNKHCPTKKPVGMSNPSHVTVSVLTVFDHATQQLGKISLKKKKTLTRKAKDG